MKLFSNFKAKRYYIQKWIMIIKMSSWMKKKFYDQEIDSDIKQYEEIKK